MAEPTPRRAAPHDCSTIASIHAKAFPDFFLTQLGPAFLREYYKCVVEYPGGILLCDVEGAATNGFVAGFVDPRGFYSMLRSRRVHLGWLAASHVLTRPRLLVILFSNYLRAGSAARAASAVDTAELASLAVLPQAAGRGAGSRLVHSFISSARELGADRIFLTTDAVNNESVNRFYTRLGFRMSRSFSPRRGRRLNEYLLET